MAKKPKRFVERPRDERTNEELHVVLSEKFEEDPDVEEMLERFKEMSIAVSKVKPDKPKSFKVFFGGVSYRIPENIFRKIHDGPDGIPPKTKISEKEAIELCEANQVE